MWPIAVTYGRTIPLFGVQLVVHQILCEWIHLTLKGLYYYHSTQISCPALTITGAVQVWPDYGGVFSILLHSTNMKLSMCNRALCRSKFPPTKWYSEYQPLLAQRVPRLRNCRLLFLSAIWCYHKVVLLSSWKPYPIYKLHCPPFWAFALSFGHL